MRDLTIQHDLIQSFHNHNEKIAIVSGSTKISYFDLEKLTNTVANYIISNIGLNKRIGLIFDDKLLLIISLIGIIKSRGTFVPISQKNPKSRIDAMINEASIDIILTDKNDSDDFYGIPNTNISEVTKSRYKSDSLIRNITYSPDDISHIYFTSGSTGNPKGILGRNGSLLHFLKWMNKEFSINHSDRIIQLSNEGFSLFKREVLGSLIAGATIYLLNESEKLDFKVLADSIINNKITIINVVPSYFKFLLNFLKDQKNSSLKYIFTAGEKLSKNLVNDFFRSELYPNTTLVNLYGPTETTQAKFYFKLKEDDLLLEDIPVGYPVSDTTEALILDKKKQALKVNQIGEIAIATNEMSFGYCKAEQNNKFINFRGRKVYLTGDVGKLDVNGRLFFLGRNDFQVKIRGIRVELKDIEHHLLNINDVIEAIVIPNKDDYQQVVSLTAFIVSSNKNHTHIYYKDELSKNLPSYMIPDKLVLVDNLPRNLNSKIDITKLIELANKSSSNIQESNNISNLVLESKLIDIWRRVLNKSSIKNNDDFFECGGNSLLGMYMVALIHSELNTKIKFSDIFLKRTISSLVELLNKEENEQKINHIFEKFPEFNPSSTTNVQKAYIIGRDPAFSLGNIGAQRYCEYKFSKRLNIKRLEHSINEIVKYHKMLRTTFNNNTFTQISHEEYPYFKLEYQDLSKYLEINVNSKLLALREELSNKQFDVTKLPLFDIRVSRTKNYDILHFSSDILIMDATSLFIFEKELSDIYKDNPRFAQVECYTFLTTYFLSKKTKKILLK